MDSLKNKDCLHILKYTLIDSKITWNELWHTLKQPKMNSERLYALQKEGKSELRISMLKNGKI